MTTYPKHRTDPVTHCPGGTLVIDAGRAGARQSRKEPLGLVSHWYPHEELVRQADLYA